MRALATAAVFLLACGPSPRPGHAARASRAELPPALALVSDTAPVVMVVRDPTAVDTDLGWSQVTAALGARFASPAALADSGIAADRPIVVALERRRTRRLDRGRRAARPHPRHRLGPGAGARGEDSAGRVAGGVVPRLPARPPRLRRRRPRPHPGAGHHPRPQIGARPVGGARRRHRPGRFAGRRPAGCHHRRRPAPPAPTQRFMWTSIASGACCWHPATAS